MIELIVKSEIELEYAELICEAVEDIRKEGGAQWSYWGSAKHILDFFDEKSCECVESILERAIQSNGASVQDDLEAVHQKIWSGDALEAGESARTKCYVQGVGWCWMEDGEVIEVISEAT